MFCDKCSIRSQFILYRKPTCFTAFALKHPYLPNLEMICVSTTDIHTIVSFSATSSCKSSQVKQIAIHFDRTYNTLTYSSTYLYCPPASLYRLSDTTFLRNKSMPLAVVYEDESTHLYSHLRDLGVMRTFNSCCCTSWLHISFCSANAHNAFVPAGVIMPLEPQSPGTHTRRVVYYVCPPTAAVPSSTVSTFPKAGITFIHKSRQGLCLPLSYERSLLLGLPASPTCGTRTETEHCKEHRHK